MVFRELFLQQLELNIYLRFSSSWCFPEDRFFKGLSVGGWVRTNSGSAGESLDEYVFFFFFFFGGWCLAPGYHRPEIGPIWGIQLPDVTIGSVILSYCDPLGVSKRGSTDSGSTAFRTKRRSNRSLQGESAVPFARHSEEERHQPRLGDMTNQQI